MGQQSPNKTKFEMQSITEEKRLYEMNIRQRDLSRKFFLNTKHSFAWYNSEAKVWKNW